MNEYDKKIYELQAENHELRKMYLSAIKMCVELQKEIDEKK